MFTVANEMFLAAAAVTSPCHAAASSSVRAAAAALVVSPVSLAYTAGFTVMVMAEVLEA